MSAPLRNKILIQEEALARGVPRLVLDVSDDSAAAVSLFLRSYRGRSEMASAVVGGGKDFADRLEQIRNHLFRGELDQAAAILSIISPISEAERGEILVESARLKLFQGKLDESLADTAVALELGALSEVSRMTCHQLRGHCLIQQKKFKEAILELDRAIALADTFSQAWSAFSARAFLVQAFAELGDLKAAERVLGALNAHVASIEQEELWVDRLLTALRAEAHLRRASNDPAGLFQTLCEARELSRWLQEGTTLAKCEKELGEMAAPPQGCPAPVLAFSGWVLLPARGLVLADFPKRAVRLDSSPIALSLILALSSGELSLDALFEQVWKLSYHPIRHESHLRSTLSKVRKLLPPGALVVRDGKASLK